MTRLPIHLLLHVAILGLLAGSGWQFYQALVVEGKDEAQRKAEREANRDRFLAKLAQGAESAGKVSVGPDYASNRAFWDALRDANFNGALPPPPPSQEVVQDVPEVEVVVPKTPLEDIFVLTAVVAAGGQSRIVVRYKPSANVEVPADLTAAPAGAGADAVPGRPTRQPRMPSYGDSLGPVHHMALEDVLWKPFENIRLVRVEPDHAVFVREDPKVPVAERKEELLYPEALELPQDVLRKLAEGLGVDTSPNEVRAGSDAVEPANPSGWVASERTTEVGANEFHIGSQDQTLFRDDPERVFNQDIGTADYRSRSGSTRGVRITKLAPGYDRFGVREGEILISLNGQPVSGKTDAIRVGKQLYKRGVRSFEGQFLTPTGQTVTRSYVMPNDR
ncbi:MAG: hypothetical protein ACO4CT_10765 [Planctomycetota bacterium]